MWAYGVLVWEVMSSGAVPYASDFPSLAEATEQIKSGFQLGCPPGCPPAVHERVMLPCWNPTPSNRPGFSALCETLEALGVVVDNNDDLGDESGSPGYIVDSPKFTGPKFSLRQVTRASDWGENLALRGPSIHHISSVLLPETLRRVQIPWRDEQGNTVDPPTLATVKHAVEAVVKPRTANVRSPHDGLDGCAYIDTLTHGVNVGPASVLLSYTWQYKMESVAAALERWAGRTGRDSRSTFVWICSLCLNQHRMNEIKSPEELSEEFGTRVQAIGHILPMLEPWDAALYLTRAWCLFELYTAICQHVAIDIILSEECYNAFMTAMAAEGYGAIDRALSDISAENATATRKADLHAIRALVEQTPGKFEQLNATVRHHLAKWFEAHGAVKTSVRRKLSRPSVSSSYHPSAESGLGSGESGKALAASLAAVAAEAPVEEPVGVDLSSCGDDADTVVVANPTYRFDDMQPVAVPSSPGKETAV